MAANMQEPNMDWIPLEDPAPTGSSRTRVGIRFAAKCFAVAGLIGLAVVAVHHTSSPGPDPERLTLNELSPLPTRESPAEPIALASQLAQVTTVHAFNKLLATSILTDAKAMYDGMPSGHLEVLFRDFLNTMGSEVPETPGSPRPPAHSYESRLEHEYRLDVFKRNLLAILRQNAEEYKRNPGASRARFGITVHADWTKEEFQSTRLNLKATDISAYEARLRQAVQPQAQRGVSNLTELGKPVELAGQCSISTGGTCHIFPCHSSRGAQCYEGACICIDGACAEGGTCYRQDHCAVSTGGTCWIFGCDSSRNSVCNGGHCVCPPGNCAVDGKCVPAPKHHESPNQLACSSVFRGPVRQQGQCGDCWAFSTAQQLRYMTFKKYRQDPGTMSVQSLVDCMPEEAAKSCSEGVKGCCGGLPFRADMWLEQSGGLPTQSAYGPQVSDSQPLTAYNCTSNVPKSVIPHGMNVYRTEHEIAEGFCEKGPVSIAIAANDALMHYTGGIMDAGLCPAEQINHAVLYVGLDKTFDNGNPVHIVLNSWGPNWGVGTEQSYEHNAGRANGHVLFKYGENVCNMEALATSPEDVELV
mmetsp:Transcript_45008/g.130200  ORF Transcript_45008/g.130200 Transcript_45008/m.130200 type:complete len:585 (+) Transcript_45008:86-1840(+)